MLEGEMKTYKSIDKVDSDESNGYIEYLRTLNSTGLPPHELKLKEKHTDHVIAEFESMCFYVTLKVLAS